jgi:Fe-S-cluster-containing hydrogenase component 2
METVAMLYVDDNRCLGCGICADVCPRGAIALRDGRASINQELCDQCEACAGACPQGAILSVTETALVPEPSHKQALDRNRPSGGGSIAARMAPAVGAALLFMGREVVPRLTDYVLDTLDRRVSRQPDGRADVPQVSVGSDSRKGSGRRRRRRQRGR